MVSAHSEAGHIKLPLSCIILYLRGKTSCCEPSEASDLHTYMGLKREYYYYLNFSRISSNFFNFHKLL